MRITLAALALLPFAPAAQQPAPATDAPALWEFRLAAFGRYAGIAADHRTRGLQLSSCGPRTG